MKEIIPSQSQIDLLCNHLISHDHKRFCYIARYTGYKIKSICILKVSDVYNVDGSPRSFIRFTNKNGDIHCSIVCSKLEEYLKAYCPKSFHLENWLFPSRINKEFPIGVRNVNNFIRNGSIRSGLHSLNMSPSSLRKAFIKHLYESGISSEIIKQMIGIKRESKLKTYSKVQKWNGLEILNNIF